MKRFRCFAELKPESGPEKVTFQGSEHYVVPVVAVKQGVLNGGYFAMSEVSLTAWDGVPVTLDHPVDADGWEISALTKEGREHWVGAFFDLQVKDDALVGNMYVDIEQAGNFKRGGDLLKSLEEQLNLSVSVGFFADYKAHEGYFDNEKYFFKYVNLTPNHIALLLDKDGACSLERGCGTNMASLQAMQKRAIDEIARDIRLHEEKMNKDELIQKLLDTEGFDGFSKEDLEAMSECGIKRLQAMQDAINDAARTADADSSGNEADPSPEPSVDNEIDNNEDKTDDHALRPEVAATLNALGADGILSVHNNILSQRKKDKDDKASLIESLAAKEECHLSKEDLNHIPLESLRAFAARLGGTDYGPMGGRGTRAPSINKKRPPAPPALMAVSGGSD